MSSAAAPAPKAEAAPPPKVEEPKVEAAPSGQGRRRDSGRSAGSRPLRRRRPTPATAIKATPLARRLAEAQGIDLSTLKGCGPGGRIVRADLGDGGGRRDGRASAPPLRRRLPPAAAPAVRADDIPHEAVKLSNMRKTIARRLTESKQQIPHIYLTLDCQLDALLKLRGELNAGLASRGVKLSVNDMLIKALALALIEVPECNVSFAGDQLIKYQPRRHFGRGQHPRRPDHADHRRRREQVAVDNLDRDDRPRRPRQGGQAAAARISGRHREPLATWACSGSSISRR